MEFVGMDAVVFGAPDVKLARDLFAECGLVKVREGRSSVVLETGIGSQVVMRQEELPDLPAGLSGGSNFREVIWGVSSRKDLDAIEKELTRDRTVSSDPAGTRFHRRISGISGIRWAARSRISATRISSRRRGNPPTTA